MIRAVIACLVFALSASPAVGKKPKPLPVPEPTVQPDWVALRPKIEGEVLSRLRDPESAVFRYVNGFEWHYASKKTYGWRGCGLVNSKNGYGGYNGFQVFYVWLDELEQRTYVNLSPPFGCPIEKTIPLQAAFSATIPKPAEPLSVADELEKLAVLRDKGIITSAEFEAQKAKLLAKP